MRSSAVLIALVAGAMLQAQQPQVRADVLGPAPVALSAGVGLLGAFGYYVRGSADISYGVRDPGGSSREEWRGDLLARFLFDPFRQQRVGLSIGGGLSIRRRTYLALIADVEGPAFRGVAPAVQAGISGGWRAGIVLRRAPAKRR
jgi:hypothetical protein